MLIIFTLNLIIPQFICFHWNIYNQEIPNTDIILSMCIKTDFSWFIAMISTMVPQHKNNLHLVVKNAKSLLCL